MKAKVHTLSEDKNFKLIGIASHLSDYKLSWLLNKELPSKFQQSEDLVIENKKTFESYKFSTYKYENEGNEFFTLYSNRSGRAILLKDIKNIDYVLKYEGEISEMGVKDFVNKIKKLKNILTAFEIDIPDLKAKEKSLFQ